jgi:N-acetylmuramoyl-L-alanine amidase
MRLRFLLPIATAVLLIVAPAASADFAHVVTPGESLDSVAATDGLSVAQLAAANGLSAGAQLVTGSKLMIPPRDGGSGGPSGSSGSSGLSGSSGSSRSSGGDYVVQPGDTLSGIAEQAGESVSQLAADNGLDPNGVLAAGTKLTLSGGQSSSSSAAGSSQPVGAGAEGNSGGPPFATDQRVSASEIGDIASANGVPPSLAQAIAWEESGFNNAIVSPSDARGVMQILPGTWDYIQQELAGGDLRSASALDNVRGGVLLLRSLLDATGGDTSLAAAGYYQGLPSVRRHGLFSDTQSYVDNVRALEQRFGGA